MANITGLHPINFSSGTEELIAVWHKTPMIVSSTAHRRTGPNLVDGQDTYFASFLDKAYMVNGTNNTFAYTGGDWLDLTTLDGTPVAKYIKSLNARLYLYSIKINGVAYPSYIWRSNLPKNNSITWGLASGSDLVTTASSAVVTSASGKFRSRGLIVGNDFIISTGLNRGNYTIQSIDSETQITLTTTLGNTDSGVTYWAGGNWIDIKTNDGDTGMGLGFASGYLLAYKKNSVHAYSDKAGELRQVKNMPGTTSPRSITEGADGYCYSYHPSGIWRTKGLEGQHISDAIYDVIEGVTTANQDNIVGWEVDKSKIKMYLGDVTLRDGDTISKCVVTFDHGKNQWSVGSLSDGITCATAWLHNNVEEIYGGSTADNVFQLNTGNSFDGNPINFSLTTHPIFPAGTENLVDFNRLRIYIDNGPDIQVLFKVYYRSIRGNQYAWESDKDWQPMRGSQQADKSEWFFPAGTRGAGVQLKVVESSTAESFLLEKMVLYWANPSDR